MEYGFLIVGLLVIFLGAVLKSNGNRRDGTSPEVTPVLIIIAGVACFVLAYRLALP